MGEKNLSGRKFFRKSFYFSLVTGSYGNRMIREGQSILGFPWIEKIEVKYKRVSWTVLEQAGLNRRQFTRWTWVLSMNNWALIKGFQPVFRKYFSAFAVYCSEICPIYWQSSKTHIGWCCGVSAVKHLPKAVEILYVLQVLAFCAENGATYQQERGN